MLADAVSKKQQKNCDFRKIWTWNKGRVEPNDIILLINNHKYLYVGIIKYWRENQIVFTTLLSQIRLYKLQLCALINNKTVFLSPNHKLIEQEQSWQKPCVPRWAFFCFVFVFFTDVLKETWQLSALSLPNENRYAFRMVPSVPTSWKHFKQPISHFHMHFSTTAFHPAVSRIWKQTEELKRCCCTACRLHYLERNSRKIWSLTCIWNPSSNKLWSKFKEN